MVKKASTNQKVKKAPKLTKKIAKSASSKTQVKASVLAAGLTVTNIETYWDGWYVEGLEEFIKVPNLTPNMDKEFLTNGKI